MTSIIIEISTYIFIALLLGYFFGWLITKIFLTQKYQGKLDAFISAESRDVAEVKSLKNELYQYKKENKILKAENAKAASGYEGQKYVLDEHNKVLDEFQKRLLSKDEVIQTLTSKLLLSEERELKLEKKHEEEIDAFMFERIEITTKYKKLLEKHEAYKRHKNLLNTNDSWFSKFFTVPSK